MKYDHIVKHDGVFYPAGADVPIGTGEQGSEYRPSGETPEAPPERKSFTKTDINKMTTAELQSLAGELHIPNADERTGGELKKLLLERFGL